MMPHRLPVKEMWINKKRIRKQRQLHPAVHQRKAMQKTEKNRTRKQSLVKTNQKMAIDAYTWGILIIKRKINIGGDAGEAASLICGCPGRVIFNIGKIL